YGPGQRSVGRSRRPPAVAIASPPSARLPSQREFLPASRARGTILPQPEGRRPCYRRRAVTSSRRGPVRRTLLDEGTRPLREIVRLRDAGQFLVAESPPLPFVEIGTVDDDPSCRAYREWCVRADPFGQLDGLSLHLLGRHNPRHQSESRQVLHRLRST